MAAQAVVAGAECLAPVVTSTAQLASIHCGVIDLAAERHARPPDAELILMARPAAAGHTFACDVPLVAEGDPVRAHAVPGEGEAPRQ
jgi:hypothetical protein